MKQFHVTRAADLVVEYSTHSSWPRKSSRSTALFLLTLGAIPLKTNTQSTVTFKVTSRTTGAVVGTYRYRIKAVAWRGWLAIPISLFVLPFADKIAEITTVGGLDLNERILDRFARDFMYERRRKAGGALRPAAIKKPSIFLAVRNAPTNPADQKQSRMLNTLTRYALTTGGYRVVDRKNLGKVLGELAVSRSGLTKDTRIKIGRLTGANRIVTSTLLYYMYYKNSDSYKATYIVHITNVENGEVEWKNLYSVTGKNIDTMFVTGSKKFLKDLRFAGYR